MEKKQIFILIEAIMMVIWVITLIIFLWALFSDGTKCLNNPLTFGVNKMDQMNNNTFTCKCNFDNQPTRIYFVDKNHWEIKDSNNLLLNLSG